MKKVFLLTLLTIFSLGALGQVKTPKPSPASTLKQIVGLTDITVKYSRPGIKGRSVFGNLVPFDKIWRTGANENTTIEFSTPVTVGGKELKEGKYAIYTKPGLKSWEVYFYASTDNWGNPKKWDDSKVMAKVEANVFKIPVKIETFTISIDDLTTDSAKLGLMWENTYIAVSIKTPANKTILENIKTTLAGKPNFKDYYTSAVYLSSTDQDLKSANAYMKKAMALNKDPKFFQLRQQSLLLYKIGDKKEAIVIAKKSLEKAKKAGNNHYIKLNTDSIKEWGGGI